MNDVTNDGEDRANQPEQGRGACDGPSCESGCGCDGMPAGNRKIKTVVLLSVGGDRGMEDTAAQIEAAAKKIVSHGNQIGLHTLKADSADSARLTSQTPAPCVITMGKGCGSSVISAEITETKLMAAFVIASRPSACGASAGCGTANCD